MPKLIKQKNKFNFFLIDALGPSIFSFIFFYVATLAIIHKELAMSGYRPTMKTFIYLGYLLKNNV
jgi:hypothetical protein